MGKGGTRLHDEVHIDELRHECAVGRQAIEGRTHAHVRPCRARGVCIVSVAEERREERRRDWPREGLKAMGSVGVPPKIDRHVAEPLA